MKGADEVGFTVLTMSLSLIAVFIPILLMGGIVGRLFQEFAVTLSAAVLVSLVVSLTTTPMLCALWLRPLETRPHGRINRFIERVTKHCIAGYQSSLHWALSHGPLIMLLLLGTIGLNILSLHHRTQGLLPCAGYR